MRKSIGYLALTTAIGVALVGAGMQSSTSVYAADLSAVSATVGVAASGAAEPYIITFAEEGLLQYRGGSSNLQATAPDKAAGRRKLDVRSSAAQAYEAHLSAQRALHVSAIESTLRHALTIQHSYSITLNGISANLTAEEAAQVATVAGVESVQRAGVQYLDTYRGPTYIGANTIWDGSTTPSHVGSKGKGMVVGVLDGGTNSTHPSFANDSADNCGFTEAAPKLIARDCSTSSGGVCNGPNPEADPHHGHGVHTSSTVAGNTISNADTPSPMLPAQATSMSGVAPCAAIRHYKVCSQEDGNCGGADVLAGIQNVIADGVDVINFSISGGNSPWSDNDRQFLNAVNADIFVAASAGNTSTRVPTTRGNVAHRGPWVLTVAASTQDQKVSPIVSVVGPGTVPADIAHILVNPGGTTRWGAVERTTNYPLRVYSNNIAGCTDTGAFPANYFKDSIALVRRGASLPDGTACSFVEKINNAADAGATFVIIANNQTEGGGMVTDGTELPSFKINEQSTSDALIAFVQANQGEPGTDTDLVFQDGFDAPAAPVGGARVDYDPTFWSQRQGDILADFSLRGPIAGALADLSKPDITGPGVDILAALDQENGNYGLMSGTSMSGPHIAGSAVLMRSVHPDWSVTEIKSAMMMTANNSVGAKEDGTTPWDVDDVGSGRMDLSKAALAGLTMDETYANFLAANPSGGTINVRDLNLASLRNMTCNDSCTWTRTVKNRLATSASWKVTSVSDASFVVTASPATFTLAAGATQTITFTATPNQVMSAIKFGYVQLSSSAAPDQRITVAVKGDGSAPPVPGEGVTCDNGICTFQLDELDQNFGGIGCDTFCPLVWLNRFTPSPTDYPITISKIQTIFGTSGTKAGDPIDFYVYLDADHDPSNGATLVGSYKGYTIVTPVNNWTTITLPTPITVNGPGDILIALTSPRRASGEQGTRPATNDSGGLLNGARSWIGDYNTVDPDLASAAVALEQNSAAGFGTFLIRASGTNAAGMNITLNSGPSNGN